ncbi:alkaline phosphatase PafA [Leeuwenhoekiella sp. W20_SRS_FM14]|uniref:alkaline phosphatase PafA n=1 Tax=Leeuwenhoekiella sp. W20_SRS_FM14 TaxID=3240270 RepID=UPI003F9C824F
MNFSFFKSFSIGLFLLLSVHSFSQAEPQKPRLVVGIVVDQMRYDYLTRFDKHYGNEGFKRLENEGFDCQNNHYNYVPTYTGPGHASVYTATTPQNHGIISNNWYNKFEKKDVYCAEDTTVASVGTANIPVGQMSPRRMKTTTVTDQNRLHTQMRGKTIGVAIKDRGSILPAGHTANGAYWFYGADEGRFVTSTYYMENLPKWVNDFNDKKKPESYMKVWDTYKPIKEYIESGSDLNDFEGGFRGKETATFPYDLKKLGATSGGYDILKTTPYGNSLTTDFAIAALDGEDLGKDLDTDFLAVSYSCTDYVGHNFGVNSKEIQDTYVRLDLELARLFKALDKQVGKGNYTVFLTADHAAVNVPAYLTSVKIPSGYFKGSEFNKELRAFVAQKYGRDDLIENISNYQVFFSYEVLENEKINAEELQKDIKHFALQYEAVAMVYTRAQMEQGAYESGVASLVQKGFNQKRSGDVFIVLDPGYLSGGGTGSSHGSAFSYDTHVPLLFYGNGINKGKTTQKTVIPDIAATISALLGIEFPNGTTGEVISEVLK